MAIEEKIYNGYAFSENELLKRDMNMKIHDQLIAGHRIYRSDNGRLEMHEDDFINYDIIIERSPGYNHAVYNVLKNSPMLSDDELMLICDGGSLVFGGIKMYGSTYRISED